jgi:hypothetical protein
MLELLFQNPYFAILSIHFFISYLELIPFSALTLLVTKYFIFNVIKIINVTVLFFFFQCISKRATHEFSL